MKFLLLTNVLLSFAVSATEMPLTQSGPNHMQFTGRVFTLAANAPLKIGKSSAKIGYAAAVHSAVEAKRGELLHATPNGS